MWEPWQLEQTLEEVHLIFFSLYNEQTYTTYNNIITLTLYLLLTLIILTLLILQWATKVLRHFVIFDYL